MTKNVEKYRKTMVKYGQCKIVGYKNAEMFVKFFLFKFLNADKYIIYSLCRIM